MTDMPPGPGGSVGPEELPVRYWVAQAEIGWVPTTLLEPYRQANSDYELYQLVTSVLGGFVLSDVLLAWLFSIDTAKRFALGMLLLVSVGFLGFSSWRLYHLQVRRNKWWNAIEKAKTYPTSETGPSATW